LRREDEVATNFQTARTNTPKTVLAAKRVELALVTWTDDAGVQSTQLAIVGDKNIHLLDGRSMGLSRTATPQGNAVEWLKKAIFQKLEESEKKEGQK
jgi:hypothetical protein